jgi:hypothetical protein
LQTANSQQQTACKCFVDEYYNWQDPQNAMCQLPEARSQLPSSKNKQQGNSNNQ